MIPWLPERPYVGKVLPPPPPFDAVKTHFFATPLLRSPRHYSQFTLPVGNKFPLPSSYLKTTALQPLGDEDRFACPDDGRCNGGLLYTNQQ